MQTKTTAEEMIDFLLENAEDSAKSSRDFGRGYMYAVRLLERKFMEDK